MKIVLTAYTLNYSLSIVAISCGARIQILNYLLRRIEWLGHTRTGADSARARSIIHTQTTTNSHDTYLISEIIYYYVFRNRLQTKWKDINLLFKLLLSFNTNTHAIYRCNYVCVLFRHTHTHIYGFGIIRSHALHTNTNTTVTMWAVLIK